ncbi:cob(I)yrinic acid a,c-diamide adenosyltransferase [Sediminitomix flava]|uniref:Corrinoid adenosyltransferase n=1 Tax=Sediminitomix flava TaxID=379075 RepID=A0A315ZBK8_SEDFL|nr:cob(I)yrinic acid a,c-diamide adenosyltransferase [Sediminitomix flava]PWJ42966.1 cob(I)alamin adenosyltransferase [Sediminitomix flava]
MKVYTKTGDKGQTSLFGGKRVSKSHIRIDAYGTVDELNSYIGLLSDFPVNTDRKAFLKEVQDRLFTLGSELAADPDKPKLKKPDLLVEDIELLETEIDKMDENLEPLKYFVLPGGHQHVSFCHIARTVCRRAERLCIGVEEVEGNLEPLIFQYLNRLSDYLFVLSRAMGKELKADEIYWVPRGN